MSDIVNKGGRPEGTDQNYVNARKSLKELSQLHKEVNKDALRAYEVLISMMDDPTTKDTVRKGIAKDVISLFMEFSAKANDVLGMPNNRHEEKQHKLGEVAKGVAGSSVVTFSTKAQ